MASQGECKQGIRRCAPVSRRRQYRERKPGRLLRLNLRYTLVPSHFELHDLASVDFYKRQHHHVNKTARDEMVADGLIECLDAGKRIYRYTGRSIRVRGLSARHGEAIAEMLAAPRGKKEKRALGNVLLSEITRRPDHGGEGKQDEFDLLAWLAQAKQEGVAI